MALRNQPYIPLYVQDFLTDEKLIECSAQATGVYIRLMCIMHKSEPYGTILLKQKDKQNGKQTLNFALKLAKHLPYDLNIIESSLDELISEGVIILEEDRIFQKRMVKDNDISDKRAKAGAKGGKFAQAKVKANIQANSEIENEDETEYESKDENFVFTDLDLLKAEMLNSEQWIEITAMSLKTEISNIKSLIPVYCLEQKSKGKVGSIFKEYKSHFYNWSRIKLKDNVSQPGPIRKEKTEADIMREKEERIKGYDPSKRPTY